MTYIILQKERKKAQTMAQQKSMFLLVDVSIIQFRKNDVDGSIYALDSNIKKLKKVQRNKT